MNKNYINILLSFFGFSALLIIVNNYGVAQIINEFQILGVSLLIILLSFIPVLLCYAISWLLITDSSPGISADLIRNTFKFWIFMTISVAWNNLTPFIRMGGEPMKYLLLRRDLGHRQAITSTVNYNLIHTLSTLLSFFIFSILVLSFITLTKKWYLIFLISTGSLALIISIGLMGIIRGDNLLSKRSIMSSNKKFKSIYIHLRIAIRNLHSIFIHRPSKFFLSLFFDTIARFIEGLTFYLTFMFLNNKITIFNSILIDVGRAFIDNIFFFIPFQLGVREEGVGILMNNILSISLTGFISAVLVYRFVEIFWITIGYLFWIMLGNSKRELIIISAE